MDGRGHNMTDDSLSVEPNSQEKPSIKHNIEELRGLGKEIWEGVDAQEYVDSLRQEWESPPF